MSEQLATDVLEIAAINKGIASNAAEVVEMGHEAAKSWNTADKESSKGDQLAIKALFNAWHKVTLAAIVVNRKGEFVEKVSFVISDLLDTPVNADGTRNNGVITARTNAVAEYIFGIVPDDVDQAFKNRLNRALEVVEYFVRMGFTEEQIQLVDKKIKLKGKLVQTKLLKVPFTALNDAPVADDEGKIDDEKLDFYNRNKDMLISLDGTKQDNGKTRTVAELARRAKPPVERHGASEKKDDDKGQAFGTALKFMTATLHSFTDEKAKANGTDIAFNKSMRRDLWELHQLLTVYFEEVEPLDREEEQEIKGRKTA